MAGITLAREAKRLRAELDARKGEEAELAVLAHKLRARAPIWTESPGWSSEDVIAEVDWLAVARIVRDHFRASGDLSPVVSE